MTKKVLVCEDDEGILDVTKIILEDIGHEVIAINESTLVYEKIDEYKPDIVLIDLWMPNLSGEEIVRTLKEQETTKDLPVVIISASKDTEKVAKDSGADGFLCKPFSIKELEEAVDNFI